MSTFDRHLEKLLEFISIPSVASLEENANDVILAAEFLVRELTSLGFDQPEFKWAKGYESTPPVVYAEKISDPTKPTILLYGHYDVQPAEPLEEWLTDPFDPIIESGVIRGRGSGDDKGQIMTHLAALKDLKEEWGNTWPINVKVIFEGEEELGSPHAPLWLAEQETKKLLKADVAILSDTGFATKDTPAITYALRGLVYFVIDVTLGSTDLHSGEFGGGVLNPAHALSYIFTKLYDIQTGKILVPEFYDDVVDVAEGEREKLAKVPFSEKEFYKDAGNAAPFAGESEYTLKERTTARPTLDVSGIWGGDTSSATKTTIPASVHAKFSCRIVANQDPQKIGVLVENYVTSIAPKGVTVHIRATEHGERVMVDVESIWVKKVADALSKTFGKEAVFDRTGGSIPMVTAIQKNLGLDAVVFGYTLPEDHFHAPNEKLDVEQFRKGIEANKLIYKSFAEK